MAWAFSWAIKLIKSPVFTIIGLFVVAGLAISGRRVDFRRGALFVEVGAGTGGLTLGAIVYTQSGNFDSNGNVRDDVARHEAYHTRTVAALGEWGFYVTYVTFGSVFAWATGGGNGMRSTTGAAVIRLKNILTLTTTHGLGAELERGFGRPVLSSAFLFG